MKKLKNNARIGSTSLKEAVDPMVPASNMGVIGDDGKIIIPFSNKSIRPVNDDILLVETPEPISQGVKDAIQLKQDPLAATKLVSTPALIKDKINKRMGSTGRYLFNDQFSEVTICDIDGNNLVNDEYYSFVAFNNDQLYLSKNTVDCEIQVFSLAKEIVQVDVPSSEDSNIDVSELNVESDVVEKALNPEPDINEEVASLGEDIPQEKEESSEIEEVQSEEQSVIPEVVENPEEDSIADNTEESENTPEEEDSEQVQETPQEEGVVSEEIPEEEKQEIEEKEEEVV